VDHRKETLWRALPFVMAMLLLTLVPATSASALFRRAGAEQTQQGAPIARSAEIRAYRGVPYAGTLRAVDNEGEAMTFSILSAPVKGTLSLDGDAFVYTPDPNRAGTDSFTFAATDESGHVSAGAEVKIRIERAASGVRYADMEAHPAATAAVDLAEHGVFVGTQVGGSWFFEPEHTLSRSEFVAMAMAAAGLKPSSVTVTGFCDDESIPAWAKSYAAGALASGVVRGVATEEGVAFLGGETVTLDQAAVVLNRLLGVTDVDMSDYYGEDADAWYAQAVMNLESVSILSAGSFAGSDPSRALTRAEAAELLSAAMALVEARRADDTLWARLFG